MGDVPVTPQAPAAAYFPMVEILGEDWFLRRQPERGVRLEVIGRDDRAITQWDMTAQEAQYVVVKARSDPRVLSIITTRY